MPEEQEDGRLYGIIILTVVFSISGFVFLLMAVFAETADLPMRFSVILFAANGFAAAYGLWLERGWGWNLAIVLVGITAAFHLLVLPVALSRSPSLMQGVLSLGVLLYLYSVRERFNTGETI